MKDFSAYGITFSGVKNIEYDLNQLMHLYLNARCKNEDLTLPENLDGMALAQLLDCLNKYDEAFSETKKGLERGWFCGYSLLSSDEKSLYVFSFADENTPLYINGVKNKNKTISVLPEKNTVASDSSAGLGAGPGTIWIKINKNDVHYPCTVIKIAFDKKIDLYSGTGAPITQN